MSSADEELVGVNGGAFPRIVDDAELLLDVEIFELMA